MFEERTYGDIVTANKDKVEPLGAAGIAGAKLDEKQRALLWKLIEVYAGNFEPGLAQARLARAKQGGIEAIRFGWAGSTARGKPHYYRVQGPLFLIEYDASQNDGNHIHTVWRDFSGDFGRDLLRRALRRGARHPASALMRFVFFFFMLSRFGCVGGAGANPQAEAELVAERDALVPGEPITVALRLEAIPGWHTYWRNPGDSGEPTRIEWRLPPGFAAGEIEWPVPVRIPVGPLMNFGYKGEVLLLDAASVPPADLAAERPVTLRAKAYWLVCEVQCLQQDAELSLDLPVARKTAARIARWGKPIAAARARFRSRRRRNGRLPREAKKAALRSPLRRRQASS